MIRAAALPTSSLRGCDRPHERAAALALNAISFLEAERGPGLPGTRMFKSERASGPSAASILPEAADGVDAADATLIMQPRWLDVRSR